MARPRLPVAFPVAAAVAAVAVAAAISESRGKLQGRSPLVNRMQRKREVLHFGDSVQNDESNFSVMYRDRKER